MIWTLERQGPLPAAIGPSMTAIVGPKGEAHFLVRDGDGDAPERVLYSGDTVRPLGPQRYGLYEVFSDGRVLLAGLPSKRSDDEEKTAILLSSDPRP